MELKRHHVLVMERCSCRQKYLEPRFEWLEWWGWLHVLQPAWPQSWAQRPGWGSSVRSGGGVCLKGGAHTGVLSFGEVWPWTWVLWDADFLTKPVLPSRSFLGLNLKWSSPHQNLGCGCLRTQQTSLEDHSQIPFHLRKELPPTEGSGKQALRTTARSHSTWRNSCPLQKALAVCRFCCHPSST